MTPAPVIDDARRHRHRGYKYDESSEPGRAFCSAHIAILAKCSRCSPRQHLRRPPWHRTCVQRSLSNGTCMLLLWGRTPVFALVAWMHAVGLCVTVPACRSTMHVTRVWRRRYAETRGSPQANRVAGRHHQRTNAHDHAPHGGRLAPPGTCFSLSKGASTAHSPVS